MFGLEALDVLIGLVTIYLTFALACTAIVEALAAWLSIRSRNLEEALKEFFAGEFKGNKSFVQAFYEHPLVQALSKGKEGKPSYIQPEIVGQVVYSLVTSNDPAKKLEDALNALPNTAESNRIKGLLTALSTQVGGDAVAFRKAVETHFDAAMDRASGWTKRYQQFVALVVSALLVGIANVDTISLTTALSSSPELRAKMIAAAELQLKTAPVTPAKIDDPKTEMKKMESPDKKPGDAKPEAKDKATPVAKKDDATVETKKAEPPDKKLEDVKPEDKDKSTPAAKKEGATAETKKVESPDKNLEDAKQEAEKALKIYTQARAALETSGLQFSWKDCPLENGGKDCFSGVKPENEKGWAAKIIGLLISTFAISLGAPFWFDLLQRFMQVRQAGVSPREKK